jgi:hypothetical protein
MVSRRLAESGRQAGPAGATPGDRASIRAHAALAPGRAWPSPETGATEVLNSSGLALDPDGSPLAVTYSADEFSTLVGTLAVA